MTQPVNARPTLVELLEQHGLRGERLVVGLMELTHTTRAGAIDQIRSAHGEFRGDMRIIPGAPPEQPRSKGVGAGMAQWFFGARCCRR